MLADIAKEHLHFHHTHRAVIAMEVNYPDGTSTGWHSHPRGQLLYAIEGVMIVYSADGTWIVPSNRALWLSTGLAHDVKMLGQVKIRTVFINEHIVRHMPGFTCVIEVSNLLRELIVAAVGIPLSYRDGSRDERILQLIADEVRVSDQLPLNLPMPIDPRIKTICEGIVDKPSNVFTAEQWSKRIGASQKTVQRIFVKETGMTFTQWRRQARLLLAVRKIASGERIIDVAFDCGYASQSAFTAMFRKHFKKTPSEFYR